MLERLSDYISENKKMFIALIVVIVIGAVLMTVMPIIRDIRTNRTPVVSLYAKCEKSYTEKEKLDPDDFSVTAVHKDGSKEGLDTDQFALGAKSITTGQDTTKVKVIYLKNRKITCTADVKNARKAVKKYYIGKTNRKSVQAVVYDTGELRFRGKGDILNYGSGDTPWKTDDSLSVKITSVSFDKTVTPTNLDNLFASMEDLKKAGTIPSSVVSMNGTFSSCTSLQKGADWSDCDALRDITKCYYGCTSLVSAPALPTGVTVADSAFASCTSLVKSPDPSAAESLKSCTYMYSECSVLSSLAIPPHADDISNIAYSCTNLQKASVPGSVTVMDSAFASCSSLATVTYIPSSAISMENAFSNCRMLNGSMRIDAKAKGDDASGMFEGACASSQLNLTGTSKHLKAYAQTNGAGNVTVGGKAVSQDADYE